MELSTRIIDIFCQRYLQAIQTASAKLECMNLKELQQLRDIVYPVGMVANRLYEQFSKKAQRIDSAKQQVSKSFSQIHAILEESNIVLNKINQLLEARGQKLGDLPAIPQVVPYTEISPESCCNAIVDQITQLSAGMNTMPVAQLQDRQQQLNTIGTNAHDHMEKIEAVCHQAVQADNTASKLPVIDKLNCIVERCKLIQNQADDLIKSKTQLTEAKPITGTTTQAVNAAGPDHSAGASVQQVSSNVPAAVEAHQIQPAATIQLKQEKTEQEITAEVRVLSLDRLRDQLEEFIGRKNAYTKEFHRQEKVSGYSQSQLAQLKIEHKHTLEQIDVVITINEKVFREKINGLSIDELKTLHTALEQKVDKLAWLEKSSLASLRNVSFEMACKYRLAIENYKAAGAAFSQRDKLVSDLLSEEFPRLIPEHLALSHNTIAAWLWPNYNIVNRMWARVNEIKEYVRAGLSGFQDEINAARGDQDALQRIYENQVRACIELRQFLVALCKCDTPEYHATNAKLITAVQQIDAKLEPIIATLETEKNVSSISLPAMAETMQYERAARAKQYEHDHPLEHGAKLIAGAYVGSILNVGGVVTWGGGKPVDYTVHAGPLSKTYAPGGKTESDPQVLQDTEDRHAELVAAQAKKDAALETQSSTTADPAPAPAAQTTTTKTESISKESAQQQLNVFEDGLKHSGKPLTADQQNLLDALHGPIITGDKFETDSAQTGKVPPALLDLVTTTTMTAIEQANAGHMRDAQALADMKNYLIECANAGSDYFFKAIIDNANVTAPLAVVTNMHKDALRQQVYVTLMLFNEVCEITGALKGTLAKENLERVITTHIQEDIVLGQAIATELKTTTKHLFKEGKFIGICRIGGYVGGTVAVGAAIQKVSTLLSRVVTTENSILTTAEVLGSEKAAAEL